MKYLALLLLLIPLGCDTTRAALEPESNPQLMQVSAQVATFSHHHERLIPENIPTEVLDLLFQRLFQRLFGGATCRSGSDRLDLLGLEVKALQSTRLALQIHSRHCAMESIDLINFSETNGRWMMATGKSQVITP
ncbi:MAG: hypothetical protein NT174_08205 [Actinobacteria bacterium]|nr:hypothetical protein [Actinomycetota bacterium]